MPIETGTVGRGPLVDRRKLGEIVVLTCTEANHKSTSNLISLSLLHFIVSSQIDCNFWCNLEN
jgi:hypothetical protein